MSEITQREKDIFAYTEVLAKTLLDREWKIGGTTVTITINVQTYENLTINVTLKMEGV